METGRFNKENYDNAEELTSIAELKAYDIDELRDVLNKNGMNVLECRSIGSLTHLYLLHLYRQNSAQEVHKKTMKSVWTRNFLKSAIITTNMLCQTVWVVSDVRVYLR